jgi:uncharacterized protein (TIGR02271 family)
MAKTVIGLFDNDIEAQNVVTDLVNSGFRSEEVRSVAAAAQGESAPDLSPYPDLSIPEAEAHSYAEGVRRGGTLVTVQAADDKADLAAEILERHGAIDIDRRTAEWRQGGWSDRSEGEVKVPVVEEELQVGKRTVQRGGVRVYSRLTEAPVEETVRLRQEQIKVDRRPVDRPASQADLAGLHEGTVEVTATVEEPVVSKQARVVEEVVVGKEVSERTETVRDTVRRTEVEVEKLASALAGDKRYGKSDWDVVEPEARRRWEEGHPGAWEEFKETVRSAWDKVTGRR